MDIYRVAGLGFALVMLGTAALSAIFAVLRAISTQRQAQLRDTADTLDPLIIAVLTAAASEALSKPVRLYAVQLSTEAAENWSRAGRMDVMVSHRLEQKR